MQLVISQDVSVEFFNSKPVEHPVRLCFVDSGMPAWLRTVVKPELFKTQSSYYDCFKLRLTEPKVLFDDHKALQQWGGSPGVEAGYLGDFSDRQAFTQCTFEYMPDDTAEAPIQIEADGPRIKFVFPTQTLFDAFVDALAGCRLGQRQKPLLIGDTNIDLIFDCEGFGL